MMDSEIILTKLDKAINRYVAKIEALEYAKMVVSDERNRVMFHPKQERN